MTQQFTASEVLHKLRERFASGNDVPVPDVRLTRAEFDAFADLLEAQEKAVPMAWRIRVGSSNVWGYCESEHDADFLGKQSGLRYEKQPLYTHPASADAERLAEALERTARHRAAADRIDPDQWHSVLYSWEDRALAAHSAQAQPPVQSEYAPTYPDQAKDPFWTVPGMVDTRPKTHGTQARSAARVTDAMVERAQDCLHDKGKDIGYYHMRAALEAALAAQEKPNG